MALKRYTQAELDLALAAERDAIARRYRSIIFRLMRVEFSLVAECEWHENTNEPEGKFTPAERHEVERLREEAWYDWMMGSGEPSMSPEERQLFDAHRSGLYRGEIIV
jgi:hypothetical protein